MRECCFNAEGDTSVGLQASSPLHHVPAPQWMLCIDGVEHKTGGWQTWVVVLAQPLTGHMTLRPITISHRCSVTLLAQMELTMETSASGLMAWLRASNAITENTLKLLYKSN